MQNLIVSEINESVLNVLKIPYKVMVRQGNSICKNHFNHKDYDPIIK